MPSAYWYYGLIILSLVLITASFIHKRDWKILLLHLQTSAVIHPLEIIVLIVWNGYRYLPGIVQDSRLDNYLGSYISNTLIVPASAVAINAFSLSWNHVISVAAIFTGIDWYFTELGIYQHFWWQSFYTGIGLCILYAISKWIWRGLHDKKPSLAFRLLTIYMIYAFIHNLIAFISNKGGKLFRFHVNWFLDAEKNHQLFFAFHLMITSIVISMCIGLKLQFRYRLAGIAILVLFNWFLGEYHIFVPSGENITAVYLILVSALAIPLTILLFKLAKLKYLFP